MRPAPRRKIREIARGWVVVRAVVDAMATMLFLASLFHLPLANATAINMASPLIITVLAAMFLGERLGSSRWIAIVVGFAGVLFIIQPRTDGFDGYALVCLLSTLLLSLRDLVTRRVHAAVPSILITLSNTIAVTSFAALLSMFRNLARVHRLRAGLPCRRRVFPRDCVLPARREHAARRICR
jgi:drug/metabolite transporter (DMT)-like permease